MAIQISGTTIINNSKMLEGIGGKGGIISGSLSLPNATNKYIQILGTRGVTLAAIAVDPSNNSDTNGYYHYSLFWPIRTSSSTSSRMDGLTAYNNYQGGSPIISQYINSNNNRFGFAVYQYYGGTRTCWYYFLYSGDGVPTLTIV